MLNIQFIRVLKYDERIEYDTIKAFKPGLKSRKLDIVFGRIVRMKLVRNMFNNDLFEWMSSTYYEQPSLLIEIADKRTNEKTGEEQKSQLADGL